MPLSGVRGKERLLQLNGARYRRHPLSKQRGIILPGLEYIDAVIQPHQFVPLKASVLPDRLLKRAVGLPRFGTRV